MTTEIARDRLLPVTICALVVAVAAVALRLVGMPPLNLHGPLHFIGIMDPFCGGTRATYLLLTGNPGAAARYNPGIFAFAAIIVAALVRGVAGMLTGRWLDITLSPRTRRALLIMLIVAVAALWVRQQLNADLLTQPWPTA